eukprot:6331006-Amphidinium_carterae.1
MARRGGLLFPPNLSAVTVGWGLALLDIDVPAWVKNVPLGPVIIAAKSSGADQKVLFETNKVVADIAR